MARQRSQGWHGWDDTRRSTTGRTRRRSAGATSPSGSASPQRPDGEVLELGCGTGRVTIPLAKQRRRLVGVDRSQPMLRRSAASFNRSRVRVRADIRELPFRRARFDGARAVRHPAVADSRARSRETLDSVARVLPRGGMFGIDLVPTFRTGARTPTKCSSRHGPAGGA